MRKLNLIHLGIGNVGKELVRMILENKDNISDSFGIDLNYCGLFNSKGGIFESSGLPVKEFIQFPGNARFDVKAAVERIAPPFIVIDATSSDKIYLILEKALKRGGFLVLSNKKPLAGSIQQFKKLHSYGVDRLFYETTVGAGLPVIRTLKTLLTTGDKIVEISGCFSGTLGFICSSLEDGENFSKSVQKAKKLGFTEADPREDLSGADVGRKALILARLIGQKIEIRDIKLQALYPDSFDKYSVNDFMKNINKLDKEYEEKFEKAKVKGNTFRYVAKVSPKSVDIALTEVSKESDLGSLKGPDNMIVFKTKRYLDRPMVIKGPGAGPEVTAAGVFGDILNVAGVI